jgi:hypothetical protein
LPSLVSFWPGFWVTAAEKFHWPLHQSVACHQPWNGPWGGSSTS